jgi:hypothetical protein
MKALLGVAKLTLKLQVVNIRFPAKIRHVSYFYVFVLQLLIPQLGKQKLVLFMPDILQASIRCSLIPNPKLYATLKLKRITNVTIVYSSGCSTIFILKVTGFPTYSAEAVTMPCCQNILITRCMQTRYAIICGK